MMRARDADWKRQAEPRIFWAGDSTVTQNDYMTYPQSGIGQGIRLFIRKEVEIRNHAVNGRSTKSFIDEGRLAPVYDEISGGDFLFIQFGHNDEKRSDPSRYTEPYGEFIENLGKYISAAQNKKALPVLITPLSRRKILEDGKLDRTAHRSYRLAMQQAARKWAVPCIDLCEASARLIERTPPEVSEHWFMNLRKGEYFNYPEGRQDDTHLQWRGALVFGRLLAEGLKALGGVYGELLIRPEKLSEPFDGEIIDG